MATITPAAYATTTTVLGGDAPALISANCGKFAVKPEGTKVWRIKNDGYLTDKIGTKAASETKAVGDIVFTDGSATAYTADLTDAEKEAAVAVVFKVDGTTAYGVGLKQSAQLMWCKSDAEGYMKDLSTSPSDGSNNYAVLCAAVNDDVTDNPDNAGNYPAFEWANDYASGLTGSLASGWYIPALEELRAIYSTRATVNNALSKCDGTQFGSSGYWSSSQAGNTNSAYFIHFNNDETQFWHKTENYYVRVIRKFN